MTWRPYHPGPSLGLLQHWPPWTPGESTCGWESSLSTPSQKKTSKIKAQQMEYIGVENQSTMPTFCLVSCIIFTW